KSHARRYRQYDIRHRCAMRRALAAGVRLGLRLVSGKNSSLNGIQDLALGPEFLLEQRPLHAAIDDADRYPLTGGAGIVEKSIRRQEREDLVEDVARLGRPVAHDRISPEPV